MEKPWEEPPRRSRSLPALPRHQLLRPNAAQARGGTRCRVTGPAVSVPLATLKLEAAASELAGMFYSLLTMPDPADITVRTQWHLSSILFLQAFPNTPRGTHQPCSYLHRRGVGMDLPLPMPLPVSPSPVSCPLSPRSSPQAAASPWGLHQGVRRPRSGSWWYGVPSELVFPHLSSSLSPQRTLCSFGDYSINLPGETGGRITRYLSN